MESLPHDVVLNHIFHRLDFTSKVHLAAVCRSWRHLLSHRLSPHLPCLCVSRPPSSPSELGPNSSPTTARRQRIPVDDDYVDGTNGPYLTITRAVRIYNTLTGESAPARLSGPPTSKPGECVAAATDKDGNLYICRLGVHGDWIRMAISTSVKSCRLPTRSCIGEEGYMLLCRSRRVLLRQLPL